jgi:anti-anti-sigma factor
VVTRVHQPGIVVLTLAGEADLVTSPLIGHAINEHLQGAPQRFIIDMRHITILTSAGIGQLVEAQLRGEASNFDVALVALSDAAVHALQVSGNAEQFPIHSTIADALIR